MRNGVFKQNFIFNNYKWPLIPSFFFIVQLVIMHL